MANFVQRRGSTFVVDFGDVELPSALAKDLDTEIQTLALRTLARTGSRGPFGFGRLPPGTWGLIFSGWFPDLVLDGEQGGVTPQLRVEDHTIIVAAGMKHALALTRTFATDRRAGREISEEAILTALIQLPSVEESVRKSSAAVLHHLKGRATEDSLNAKAKQALRAIERQIDACDSVDEVDELLAKLCRDNANAQVEGLSAGLDIAQAIFHAGRSTIYSPDNPFYEVLSSEPGTAVIAKQGNQDAKDVIKADAKGAVVGGVTGGAGGGPAGAVVGAIAGSAGKSLVSALSKAWHSIFD